MWQFKPADCNGMTSKGTSVDHLYQRLNIGVLIAPG
jgi:hypothetical protein